MLHKRRIKEIWVSEKLRAHIIHEGHNEKMGARPMALAIEKFVKQPVANFVLDHKVEKDQMISLDLEGDKVIVNVRERKNV